jgi:hypothetical protein
MKGVQQLAAGVAAARRPAAADNPFLALQAQISEQITAALDAYRVARDQMAEQMFFGFYGSPLVQALLGLNKASEVRPFPGTSPEKLAARQAQADAYAAKLRTGGFDEALTRAVLYVIAAERMIDQRTALALNVARQKLMHLSLAEFKALVRDQAFLLQLEGARGGSACLPGAEGECAEGVAKAGARDRRRGRSSACGGARPFGRAVAGAGCADCEGGGSCNFCPGHRRRDYRTAFRGVALSGSSSVTPDLLTVCASMQTIVNKTFKEIAVGDAASVERTLQAGDVRAWAAAFGEVDMLAGPGASQGAAGIVTAMLTALAGSALPGPGTSIRSTSVQIKGALPVGAVMTARLVVREKRSDQGVVVLDGQCTDTAGQVFATAILEVLAPTTRQQHRVAEHRLEGLVERCRGIKPILTGVVHPCSADALAGAVEAAEAICRCTCFTAASCAIPASTRSSGSLV